MGFFLNESFKAQCCEITLGKVINQPPLKEKLFTNPKLNQHF